MQSLIHLDLSIFRFINSGTHHWFLDYLMLGISSTEFWIVLSLAFIVAGVARRDRKMALVFTAILVSICIVDPIAHFLAKPFFGRLRPCKELNDAVRTVAGCAGWYGFPSNHASNAGAALAVILWSYRKKFALVSITLALLVGYSRVYLGVHYPLDVLSGYFFGASVGTVIYLIFKKLFFHHS